MADVMIWNSVWDTIAKVTGLKINPTKTQIITLGPDCDIELLSLIGVVVPHAEHLGVYQSANPRAAYNLTYNKLIHKVKETVNRFIDLTSRADYIHKSMLIRALVNSQMLHVFRVYPPQEKEIKQLDKLVKQALWSKKYAGTLFGRVKIAASRVCAPLKWGGVNLACPRTSATQSFLSAFIAIIKHSLDYPDSMLNRIYKFTDKRLAISHWGSRSIKHEFDWLRRIIPNSWGGLQVLKETLGQMELDPTLAHHSSLWGSEYSYSLRKPPLFAFANMFPGIHTLHDILEPVATRSSNPITLNSNFSPETLSLSENFLVKFHARFKKSHKSLPPLYLGETRNFRTYPMFIIILEKPYILKRFYKKHTISKYNKIPPSYQSRINEGVDCP